MVHSDSEGTLNGFRYFKRGETPPFIGLAGESIGQHDKKPMYHHKHSGSLNKKEERARLWSNETNCSCTQQYCKKSADKFMNPLDERRHGRRAISDIETILPNNTGVRKKSQHSGGL